MARKAPWATASDPPAAKKKLLRLRQTELFPSAQSLRTRKSVGRCKRCAKCAEFVDVVHILHVSQSFVQKKCSLKKDDCKCRSVSCPRLVESTNGLALADFDGSDGWLVEEKNRRQRQLQTVNAAENTQSVQLSIRVSVGIQHQPQMFMKNIEKLSNNSNHGKCESSLCAFHCSLVVASHCFRCEGHFGFFSPSPALRLCRLPGVLQCKALHKFRASCRISIV